MTALATEPPAPAEPQDGGGVGRDSSARLAAELGALVLGTAGAIITARWLGPSGKGVSATLIFLSSLFGRLAALGLGDSAMIMVGRHRAEKRRALQANLGAVLISGAIGACVCAAVAIVQIDPGSNDLKAAVALTAVGVVLVAVADTVNHGLTMQGKIVEASAVVALIAATSIIGIVVFVVVLDLGVLGASIAGALGGSAGIIGAARQLGAGFSLRPRWDPGYLRQALRYGAKLELSTVLALVAGRVDLLFVYSIAGSAAAGNYSVALTIATIAGLAPFALSYATFPRLAYAAKERADELNTMLQRTSIAACLVAVAGLAAISPLVIPFAFGAGFDDAIAPTLLLLAGVVPASAQWTLARALAARGDTTLLVTSFLVSALVMVGLDLLLIGPLDLVGAGIASVAGGFAGLAVCIQRYQRSGRRPLELIPGAEDFRLLASGAAHTLRTAAGFALGQGRRGR